MIGYMRAWMSRDGKTIGLHRKTDDPGPELPSPDERDGMHWVIEAQRDGATKVEIMREAAWDGENREWIARYREDDGDMTPWYWEERANWYGQMYVAPAVNSGENVFLNYDGDREGIS